jgi:hypothetical protein
MTHFDFEQKKKTKRKLFEHTYMPTSGVGQKKKTHIASGSS